MQDTTAAWRKTKSGEWVAYGTTTSVRAGIDASVMSRGNAKLVHIERTGRPFMVGGVEMVYGYVTEAPRHPSTRSTWVETLDCGHRADRPARGCYGCANQIGL